MAIKDKVVNIVLSAKDKAGGAFGKLFGNLKKTSDQSGKAGGAIGRLSKRLKAMQPSLKTSGKALKQFGKGVAGIAATVGASIAGLTLFSKKQASIADDLTNSSNAIGINRETLQAWQIAGERVGVSGEGVVKTLTSVAERLGKLSATGSGRAGRIFDALNMDIEEFRQLAPDQQLIKLAGAVEKLPKGEQVGVLRALGTDAEKLMPLLEDNAAGLKAITEEASQAGAIYSEKELDKLNKANDVYNSIDVKLKGLTARIGAELAPAVGEATDAVLDLFGQGQTSDGFINIFKRLAAGVKDFATSVVSNQDSIVEGFNKVIGTAKFLGNAVTGVFRGVQTVASGVVTLISLTISNFLSEVQGVSFALNKVGLVSDETYSSIKAKAAAARATTADLAKQTAEYGKATVQAGADALNSFDSTTAAATKAEAATKKVNEEVKKTTEELLAASEAQEEALGAQLASLEGDVEKAVSRTTQAWKDYYAASGEARVQANIELNESIKEENRLRIEASKLAQQLTDKQAESERLLSEVTAKKVAAQKAASKQARDELSKLGIDVNKVMKGISTDAQEAIDGIDGLAGEIKKAGLTGEQSAEAFKAGFSDAIEAVNSKEGLTELQEKIKGLKEAGEIGAEGANTALETIRKKMLQIKLPDLGEEEAVESIDKAGDAVDGLSEKLKKLKKEKEEAAKEAQEFREALGAAFSKALTNARTAVTNLSTAARNLFEEKIGSNMFVDESVSASEALEKARQRTDELASSRRRLMSSSLAAWFADTALAAAQVKEEFYAQAVAMENLTDKVNSGSLSLDQLDRMASRASSQFSLLDDQRLQGLQSAIDQARSKIESLDSSAESTLNSLQQRLADIQGDTEKAQQLQYEAERKRLQVELENARQAGADNAAADYSNALQQLEKINSIEQRNRREAENERERQAAERQRQQQQAERERQQFERQRSQSTTAAKTRTETVKTVNVNLGGQSVRVLAGDEDNLIRALENARSTAL